MPTAGAGLRPVARAALGFCAAVGHPHRFSLRAPAGGVCRAWSSGRAHSVERRQTSGDLRQDGVLSALGAAAELAGNGACVPDQLGSGLSVGGMVCAMGLGAAGTARYQIHWGGRDSLGTRPAGEQLFDRHLPNRRPVPTLAMGGTTALASHAAARPKGTGAGGGKRVKFCVQRHVEALLASPRRPGWSRFARAGPFPYHEPFESGGRSGAARGEHTPTGPRQASGRATQAPALDLTAPRQPGTRASTTKAQYPARQQAGHRTRLGVERDLLPFLALQIRDLGRSLSRLWVFPRSAQPPRTHEKDGTDATRP